MTTESQPASELLREARECVVEANEGRPEAEDIEREDLYESIHTDLEDVLTDLAATVEVMEER